MEVFPSAHHRSPHKHTITKTREIRETSQMGYGIGRT